LRNRILFSKFGYQEQHDDEHQEINNPHRTGIYLKNLNSKGRVITGEWRKKSELEERHWERRK